MKKLFLSIAMAVAALSPAAAQTGEVNITPIPYEMTVGRSEGLTIPKGFTVAGSSLPDDMKAELDKFVKAINAATGLDGKVTGSTDGATFAVGLTADSSMPLEGYTLAVTSTGVRITARSAAGLFYAFQTVKLLLPDNVMAGLPDATVKAYTLPAVDINDRPTFAHRGFELDCARHFHSMDQIKRMLDIMSFYKMNRFHWHLTDDQGWRVEIEKYPRLTQVGSIAPDAYLCHFATRTSYMNGAPYGPFFYTKDDLREIVAYAAERHIEVFPEIDMPGHMVAAIAAYPQFSCTPEGDHTIWINPGVSKDVLNVASPEVIQFCKDVVTELAEVFPAPLFHIGGDETPTQAWENNAECQALMKREGFTDVRQLQSWFTKQIAEHINSLGKQPVCWNEVVTAAGADPSLPQEENILVYDWLGGGTAKAAELGLNSVYCEHSKYYLDYAQSSDRESEPRSMSYGTTLSVVYDAYPDMSHPGTVIGVQGNLWTELISDPRHMEYNAMPRLIAIAETGWSPREKKNLDDFRSRIAADTTMWNLLGYEYGRHDLREGNPVPADRVMPDPETWVTVATKATGGGRQGRVLELVAEGSSLIGSNGAKPGQLWSAPAEGSEAQQWRFIPDPEGSGYFAIVCKAAPEGSVNPDPGSTSADARWTYDYDKHNYCFILGEGSHYGDAGNGMYFYSIRSKNNGGFWLNCGTSGDSNLAVNCWHDPADGDGGRWLIKAGKTSERVMPDPDKWVAVTTKATSRNRAGRVLELVAEGSPLIAANGAVPGQLWTATASEGSDAQQWRFIPDPAGSGLYAIICKAVPEGSVNPDPGSTSTDARWTYDTSARHYNFILGEGSYYGKADSGRYFYSIRSDRNAGFWLNCGTDAAGENLTVNCWHTPDDGDGGLWLIAAEEPGQAKGITYECRTPEGLLVSRSLIPLRSGDKHTVAFPEIPYFTFVSSETTPGTEITFTEPVTLSAVYSTDAHYGAKGIDRRIEDPAELAENVPYLLKDDNSARTAFRYADPADGLVKGTNGNSFSPYHIWNLRKCADGKWAVYNPGADSYVGSLVRGNTVPLSTEPVPFTFTLKEGSQWYIGDGNLMWDGGPDLSLHGWDAPGHPYWICTPEVAPYYQVSIEETDAVTGETIAHSSRFIPAGFAFYYAPAYREGRPEVTVTGAEGLDAVTSDKAIRTVYAADPTGIEDVTLPSIPARKGVYDLQGRRIEGVPAPGLYIIDGRKTLVR